jgi:hypothetical protein
MVTTTSVVFQHIANGRNAAVEFGAEGLSRRIHMQRYTEPKQKGTTTTGAPRMSPVTTPTLNKGAAFTYDERTRIELSNEVEVMQ